MKSLSILICTHDRAELLKRTIDFINTAERPDNYQLSMFVVANACTDNTVQYLKQYQQTADSTTIPIEWIEELAPGKSNALNSAIPKLKADVIAMVDDDHRIDNHYLTAIASALTAYPAADFFCGKIIPDWDGSEPHWVHEQGKYRIYPLPVPRFDLGEQAMSVTRKIAVPGGGNLVLKKELFTRIGNFSTDFGPVGHNLGGAEDIEWVIRAYQSGAHLQYIPEIIQYHYVESNRMTLAYVIKKAYERTSSTIRLDEKALNYTGLFPRYLLRKLIKYFFYSLFSISNTSRRFHLVRLAATVGEIKGFLMVEKVKT